MVLLSARHCAARKPQIILGGEILPWARMFCHLLAPCTAQQGESNHGQSWDLGRGAAPAGSGAGLEFRFEGELCRVWGGGLG